jgi:hypothetical protein
MSVPRSVADFLADHVLFEMECIDRMFLNVYVPSLQYPARLVAYVTTSESCGSPRPRRWRRSVRVHHGVAWLARWSLRWATPVTATERHHGSSCGGGLSLTAVMRRATPRIVTQTKPADNALNLVQCEM